MTTLDRVGHFSYELVRPLDWSQLMAFLWEGLDRYPEGTPDRWSRIAGLVNTRCPARPAVTGGRCEEVYRRLAEAFAGVNRVQGGPGWGLRAWTMALYEAVGGLVGPRPMFMNLGFATSEGQGPSVSLAPEDEPDRLSIQLYRQLLGDHLPAGQDVLEVGCGRGGGCTLLARDYRPRRLVGLDLVPINIDACRRLPDHPGMTFMLGDAEDLPFPAGCFDAVVSVESSHSYPSMHRFFAEVVRVLRPGGLLFLADHRPVVDEWGPDRTFASLVDQIRRSGLAPVGSRDITANVHESIGLMDDAKRQFLAATATGGHDLTHLWEVFHCRGSRNHEVFRTGAWRYGSFVLRKPCEDQ